MDVMISHNNIGFQKLLFQIRIPIIYIIEPKLLPACQSLEANWHCNHSPTVQANENQIYINHHHMLLLRLLLTQRFIS